MTTSTTRNALIRRTNRFNKLGDELIVIEGYSDAGEPGFFTAVETNIPGRDRFRTPKCFFRIAEHAFEDLDSTYYSEFK